MVIAVVICHNKTDAENVAQIDALLSLLDTHLQTVEVPEGPTEIFSHYTIKGFNVEHTVKVFQIVPYQPDNTSNPYRAVLPANFHTLRAHYVAYGPGDSDKLGTHPRFFNWGLKRGTDYGADIAIYLQDPVSLTSAKARNAIGKIRNDVEFVEETWGKLSTKRLLQLIGQLKEDRTFNEAVTDLKTRVVQGGLQNG